MRDRDRFFSDTPVLLGLKGAGPLEHSPGPVLAASAGEGRGRRRRLLGRRAGGLHGREEVPQGGAEQQGTPRQAGAEAPPEGAGHLG